uniref:DDE-1 domain-containing protein n=1 Tax=Paramormyrops kingsleyae TaxID=1676925 RepID=A0A3B3RIJ6_9TELE
VAKEHVTLLLACNMDGSEKLELLTIGKNKKPRCFKNVKKLPVYYEANKNAWMTSNIWTNWLKKVDNLMRCKKRQIVILCDNCAAHSSDVRLTNIKLVFYQGIIANFKRHYRSLVLKLTILDSLHMQKVAWNRVTSKTIANCYRRAGFIKDTTDDGVETGAKETDAAADLPTGVMPQGFAAYVAIDNDLPVSADLTDESDAEEDTIGQTDANDCSPPTLFKAYLESLIVKARRNPDRMRINSIC